MSNLIESFKKYKEYLNTSNLVALPNDTPYGNLFLSYVGLVTRFDCINELIIEIYAHFEEIKKDRENPKVISDSRFFTKYHFYIEELVYWLKKSADEIIGLIYILEKFKESGYKSWVKTIEIDCIGVLLNERRETALGKLEFLLNLKNAHLEILNVINELGNSFKHSLLNSQVNLYQGIESPLIISLYLKKNDRNENTKFHTEDLGKILFDYNKFISDAKGVLAKLVPPQ